MVKILANEFIFDSLEGSSSCHASTVLPLGNNEALCAWFGGTAEGRDDVNIWVAIRKDGKWQTAQKITVDEKIPHWNPALFMRKDGTVCLYFKVGKKIPDWITYVTYSSDLGRTWSEPEVLVPGDTSGGRGPVKNKPIYLSDGRILAPASTEQPIWLPFVDTSFDEGKTWEKQMIVPSRKRANGEPTPMIQPTLWESEPGKVHMLIRTSVRSIYRSDSDDYGKTWCKAYHTNLRNPNSGIDVTKLSDGSLVLISNPVAKNWGDRAPLTLMRSFDNGETWEEIAVLEKRHGHEDEFSYPAIVADGMKLYISYTWQRLKIKYVEVEIG